MKNYRKELNKMIEHRRLYMPAIEKMLEMYNDRGNNPREITDEQDLPVILELIDIGYIDNNEVRVKTSQGVVNRVVYSGGHPLTDGGMTFMKNELLIKRNSYFKKSVIFAVLLILCIVALVFFSM